MKDARRSLWLATFALVTALLTQSCGRDVSSEPGYLPEAGDRVLMTTHYFGTDDFESGKSTGIEAFADAMLAAGQVRRTYFLDDPESHIVVEVSFFHPDSDVDEWIEGPHRKQAMDIVDPIYREPVDVQHLAVVNVHDTPVDASYLPRIGDRVIIFTMRFTADGFEQGRRIVPEGFGRAMEASAQTRRTYFTDDPQTRTMLTLSFFHEDSGTDEWLGHPQRQAVLDRIEPLFREPIEVYHLTVEAVHDTTDF